MCNQPCKEHYSLPQKKAWVALVLHTSGVMIPFFPGTGIILESLPKEPESEFHGIGSKVESVPRLESVLRAESIPCTEPVPVLNQGQTMTNLPFLLTRFQKIVTSSLILEKLCCKIYFLCHLSKTLL